MQRYLFRKISNLQALAMLPAILKRSKEAQIFFFFPFWSVGGAERVHADIVGEFADSESICFLTEQSPNSAFKLDFLAAGPSIELGRWSSKASYRTFLQKQLAQIINSKSNAVVFGCNSRFFYHLLPLLKPHVLIVDLIHAFSGPEGFEYHSLPFVPHIDKRVVLGDKTKNDFAELYDREGIPPKYIERLSIIPNKVGKALSPVIKDFDVPVLDVLFVARNSEEKRVELFLLITKLCFERTLPVRFSMIGDFTGMNSLISSNTSIIGEIHAREELGKYYAMSHMLLVTSSREGFPMVILEAMSYGVVPITTDVGEIPAYISEQNENGFLIKSKQAIPLIAEAFVERIEYLLNQRALLKDFSNNARHFVTKNFSEEKFSRAYRKLLLEHP